MSTNLEIERSHPKRPIQEVAAELGIDPAVILPHGHHIAKIPLSELTNRTGDDGALVLVTAMSPTPSGEGKTTTTIGLGDALRKAGRKTAIKLVTEKESEHHEPGFESCEAHQSANDFAPVQFDSCVPAELQS